jgi:integrase
LHQRLGVNHGFGTLAFCVPVGDAQRLALRQGADNRPKMRDLLGHSSVTVTERYAHLCPGRVREAVTVLDNVLQSNIRHTTTIAG